LRKERKKMTYGIGMMIVWLSVVVFDRVLDRMGLGLNVEIYGEAVA